MLFLPCHPRFALLLSSLLTTAVALLLPFSPIPSLPPSSAPSTQLLSSSASPQGLATHMRRALAERAYQKLLLGGDALIAKVGPAPLNVALCVFISLHTFVDVIFVPFRFPPDKEPWPPYTVCKSYSPPFCVSAHHIVP